MLQNEYFIALVIFAVSLVIAKVINFFLKNYAKKITMRTKSDLDDIILKATTKPFYLLVIFVGLYFAFKRISALSPHAMWIDNGFLIICVLITAFIFSRIFAVLINHWLRVQQKYEQTPKLISKIVAIVVYLIAILAIMGYYKIEITPIVAALGLGGLAVGLALQDTLSNFFAGLHIITDKPVNVGDIVEIEGGTIRGTVEDISWRSTRIRRWDDNIVVVPNSKLASSIITNVSMPAQQMSFTVKCGVGYASDLKKVEKITLEVAKKIQQTVPGAVKGFEPTMRFEEFGDSNINFFVVLRAENFGSKFAVTHEFIKALKERFDKEGIEISWPVMKIYYGHEKKARRKR
jgi:small-conductance mechanosensitive channel